ncbi:hypothetical protein AVEN_180458-1 [Araneus ventricosus]|uniref:Uncharacterized protein n=1 Tax=Araneus ventricosus TaxID=182803 RepID=A0A4Y2GM14_ARAVE|nr:hypothetical protein AVEN_180458-1 [Araneus ventricosus]
MARFHTHYPLHHPYGTLPHISHSTTPAGTLPRTLPIRSPNVGQIPCTLPTQPPRMARFHIHYPHYYLNGLPQKLPTPSVHFQRYPTLTFLTPLTATIHTACTANRF